VDRDTGGLAFLQSGSSRSAGPGIDFLARTDSRLADDRSGSLWIATANHVRESQQPTGARPSHDTDIRAYGFVDGLRERGA